MKLARFWINQPSTYQPAFSLHGQEVLAEVDAWGQVVSPVKVYFRQGNMISAELPDNCLSSGWREDYEPGTHDYIEPVEISSFHFAKGLLS